MKDNDDSKRTSHGVTSYILYYINGIRTRSQKMTGTTKMFKDEIYRYSHFMSKLTRNMLHILEHLFKNGGTTERLLEVLELIPQRTCNRCLSILIQLDLVNRRPSDESIAGKRFYIYKLKEETLDTYDKIELKHKELYLKLHNIKTEPGQIDSYAEVDLKPKKARNKIQCKSCNFVYYRELPEICPKCDCEEILVNNKLQL